MASPRKRSFWTWNLGHVSGIALRVPIILLMLLAWIAVAYAFGAGLSLAAIGVWMVIALFAMIVHELGPKSRLDGVPVSAAMLRKVAAVSPEQHLEDAAVLLSGGQNQVPVLDHGRVVGILTRGDVASALRKGGPNAPVADASTHGVVTVDPSDPLDSVLDRLRQSPDCVALVVDHGEAVGMVTEETLERYAALHERHAA